MLVLTFCIGPTRFVVDARRVSQVIPRVPLQTAPLAEPYVAGVLDFRGDVLAVVDLSTRLFGTACTERLSTRIIIVRVKHQERDVPLGIIAEQVTELCRAESLTDNNSLQEATQHDCLGRIVHVDGALAQWIDVDQILPEPVRIRMFEKIVE